MKKTTIITISALALAVAATASVSGDGSAVVTVQLSGSGYHWLYMGTYDEALAANDAIKEGITAETGSDKLIKGYQNDAGAWLQK